jgi:hypothetical protein
VLQAHGGDIRIESPVRRDGTGTLVEVLFPRRLVVDEAAASRQNTTVKVV